jgi:ATP-dependent Zn protease
VGDPDAEQVATAYHEAGHAVLALSLGRPIHRVSILPKQEYLGKCEFAPGQLRQSEDPVEQEILIALAGLAAEAKYCGTYDRLGASRDLRIVRKLALTRASERAVERYERRMLAKAEYLLADEATWRAVETIAAELVKVGWLRGRAARHFFEQAQRS